MNTKKIQHQPGNGDERWDVVLIECVTVKQAEFVHGAGSALRLDAPESEDRRSSRNELDNRIVNALERIGVAAGGLAGCVAV